MKQEINWLKKIWEAINNLALSGEGTQADWNESDNTKASYIKNKPTIPDAQIQADWDQSDSSKKDFIKNKPSIPDEQIQADWNQADSSKKDFIKNKPAVTNRIVVDNITAILGEQLEALHCGDQVIKSDASGEHAYIVSYKGAGGLSLSYFDCDNVETVAYTKTGDVWAYDDTTVTHIGV